MAVTFRYADGRVEERAVNTGGMGLPETWALCELVDAEGAPLASPVDAGPIPYLRRIKAGERLEHHAFRRAVIKRAGWRKAFSEYHESPPCMGETNAYGRGFCCPMLRDADRRVEGSP